MLRALRPDLLSGLGGFMLGAAALLLSHRAAADAPQPPAALTDIQTAVAHPASVHGRSAAG